MIRIFLCYRGSDTLEITDDIQSGLTQHLAGCEVFMDGHRQESIAGNRILDRLRAEIARSDVVLVVIGKHWDVVENGRRRLENLDDPVRVEIEAALSRPILTLPVLVEGAAMPKAGELPAGLEGLAAIGAFHLPENVFERKPKIARLAEVIKERRAQQSPQPEATGAVPGPGSPSHPGPRPRPGLISIPSIALAFAAAACGMVFSPFTGPSNTGTENPAPGLEQDLRRSEKERDILQQDYRALKAVEQSLRSELAGAKHRNQDLIRELSTSKVSLRLAMEAKSTSDRALAESIQTRTGLETRKAKLEAELKANVEGRREADAALLQGRNRLQATEEALKSGMIRVIDWEQVPNIPAAPSSGPALKFQVAMRIPKGAAKRAAYEIRLFQVFENGQRVLLDTLSNSSYSYLRERMAGRPSGLQFEELVSGEDFDTIVRGPIYGMIPDLGLGNRPQHLMAVPYLWLDGTPGGESKYQAVGTGLRKAINP